MEIKVDWAGEMKFDGENGTGGKVTLETGVKYGGSGKNPTPMETVLMGLASCSGMDIVMILKKMRVDSGRQPDPLLSYRESGYADKITEERAGEGIGALGGG